MGKMGEQDLLIYKEFIDYTAISGDGYFGDWRDENLNLR